MNSATDERKTCADCEHFDSKTGNIYGVCIKSSYVDVDWGLVLDWILPEKYACDQFEEMEP